MRSVAWLPAKGHKKIVASYSDGKGFVCDNMIKLLTIKPVYCYWLLNCILTEERIPPSSQYLSNRKDDLRITVILYGCHLGTIAVWDLSTQNFLLRVASNGLTEST